MNSRDNRVNLGTGDGEAARGKPCLIVKYVVFYSHEDASLQCYVQVDWGGGKGAMRRQV